MWKHGWKLIVLILVASVAFVWLIKAPIMSSYLSKKLGLQVTLRAISIWPKTTIIHHFTLENPHGFKRHPALQIARTEVDYRFQALKGNPSEIDQILLENVELNIDIPTPAATKNNWSAIGKEMPKNTTNRAVVVHKLILKNLTVKTRGAGATVLGIAGTKQFAHMEFDQIDSRNGFPTKELIRNIFQGVGALDYLKEFLDPINEIQEVLNPLHIFGEKETSGE